MGGIVSCGGGKQDKEEKKHQEQAQVKGGAPSKYIEAPKKASGTKTVATSRKAVIETCEEKPLSNQELLIEAAKTGDLDKIKELDDAHVDLSMTDGGTNCAWHYAAANGNFEIVKYLHSRNHDVLSLPANGWGLIHYACYRGDKAALEWVVDDIKGDINIASVSGWTALHAAVARGHINMVKWLLLKGSNIKCTTRKGRTILHVALREGMLDMAKWLVEQKGLDENARDRIGLTCLHQACYGGNVEVVKWLLSRGADVYVHDAYGWTVLYAAASTGEVELIQLLREKGCCLHVTEKDPHWKPSRKPRVIKGDRRSIEAQKGGPQGGARHSL